MSQHRILLSVPHLGGGEGRYLQEALATNWVAPLGPHLDAFEREFAAYVGVADAAALVSGTAALHLALILAGVKRDDVVLVSDLTFVASANPVVYLGARPVFIDADRATWNLDPNCLKEALRDLTSRGVKPAALVVTHLYGVCADLAPILALCDRYGVVVIEDAAEALGASYRQRHAGTLGAIGIYSFNGNKIITTSAGGMLVAQDAGQIRRARHLATQAREPAVHYQHRETGYNYRMSNVLAGIGRGQLEVIEARVSARRATFAAYAAALGCLPGLQMMPSPPYGRSTHWLSCCTIAPAQFGVDRSQVIARLDREFDIEARPVWKPMHLQPLFADAPIYGGAVSAELFATGICLPSSSSLTDEERERVVTAVTACCRA